MGKIKVTPCDIKGLYVIEPTVFKDERGYFMETYNQNDFHEAGLDMVFVEPKITMETLFSSRFCAIPKLPSSNSRSSPDIQFTSPLGATMIGRK